MNEKNPAKTTGSDKPKAVGEEKRPAYRPQEKLPDAVLAEIGPPPEDDIKRRAWYAKVIAVQTWGIMRGRPWKAMNEATRACALADARLTTELVAEKVRQLLIDRERDAADEHANRAEVRKDQDGAPRIKPLRSDT